MISLSILICSLFERSSQLKSLLKELYRQIDENDASGIVEILIEVDNREQSTGFKRNILYQRAKGTYCISHDDDDTPSSFFIEELLKGIKTNPDCIGMCGYITTNGANEKMWYISKDNPYTSKIDEHGNEIYLRYPNHITCIKTSIAQQFKFPNKTYGEDFEWATAIHNSGKIKTEYIVNRPMYYYNYKTNK